MIILNSLLPLLILCISCSVYRNRANFFLSRITEAISQLELKNILKMIPQAIFFIDEATNEVLHQSDAMETFFGQSVDKMLNDRIFEVKAPQNAQ